MRDHPGERPPWWQTTPMRDHPDNRPPQWETVPVRDHLDDRPPWWETILIRDQPDNLMRDHPDERPSRCETARMRDHPDERAPWWESTSQFKTVCLFFETFFVCKCTQTLLLTLMQAKKWCEYVWCKLRRLASIYKSLNLQDWAGNARGIKESIFFYKLGIIIQIESSGLKALARRRNASTPSGNRKRTTDWLKINPEIC